MDIKIFKACWGMESIPSLDEKLRMISEAGYDGFEWAVWEVDPPEVRELCEKYKLLYIAQIFVLNAQEQRDQMEKAVAAGAIKADSHTGRDRWSDSEAKSFWREALALEKDIPLPVAHETHRYRMFYSPWTTAKHLADFPDISIAADFSHWCCVCETMLDDMEDFIDVAIPRAIHIHARVGYEEGPQVSDPAAPEFANHLKRHAGWWDRILEAHKKRGEKMMTITPEFGPAPYQHRLPYTCQPTSDLWEINYWMRNYLKKRWSV